MRRFVVMVGTENSGGVLVTGASTGIGEATALRLDSMGFRVFAGVRKEDDGERLRKAGSERLRIVHPLDVTHGAHIEAAARLVEEELAGDPLRGIVNNAGVATGGPLEAIELDELRKTLEVNSVGPLAVAQAFLPMLRRSRGRIVNMSSIGGRVAQPLAGPYIASKFAIEAINDVLRLELMEWGIDVIAIEPGTIATPIWEKGSAQADELVRGLSPEHRKLYGRRGEKMAKLLARQNKRGAPPSKVADAVADALTSKRPKTRYLVGDARMLLGLKTVLPARLFDRLLYRLTS
jgi:NAD(P)-dependent dehydrogenase (short-subunit alcohol dehydrogenase family)